MDPKTTDHGRQRKMTNKGVITNNFRTLVKVNLTCGPTGPEGP